MNRAGRTSLLTALALLAFAANSIICRFALLDGDIDPASFTSIRLLSGALTLFCLFSLFNRQTAVRSSGSWLAAVMLFIYAITFSFAYVQLETGTGALVLFGAVQMTILLVGFFKGTRLSAGEILGMVIAVAGLFVLVLPGLSSPPLMGVVLMAISGAAWGFYTLSGQGSKNALADSAFNFVRTAPMVAMLVLFLWPDAQLSSQGVWLAVLSGAVTSGLGYILWYTVLPDLSVTEAAVVQLAVPIIAALGGVVFIAEAFSLRLLVSMVLVLGGILLVILKRRRPG